MNRRDDFAKFTMVIGKLFAGYGGRTVGDLDVEAYWDDLSHLTLAQVVAAIPEAKQLAERGFPPDSESIRRCAEKQPAAPYHARLLPPPVAQPWTPEQLADWDALDARMRARLKMSDEVLSPRQWPDAKGMK